MAWAASNQQTPGVSLALPADVAGAVRLVARLPDLRVQAEVPHQFGGALEPGDVTDDGDNRCRGRDADARDRQESTHPQVVNDQDGDVVVDALDLLFHDRKHPQIAVNLGPLVGLEIDVR